MIIFGVGADMISFLKRCHLYAEAFMISKNYSPLCSGRKEFGFFVECAAELSIE